MRQPSRLTSEIRSLRRCLRSFDLSLRRLTPMLSVAASLNEAPKANGRARSRLFSKARASLVLQGRYMGYMRQLKPRQKEQAREMRGTKGVKAAISDAKRMAF
jgi:hypothetical protein